MRKKKKNWLPIQEIKDCYLVNGNGDITVGYKVDYPGAYTLSPEVKNYIYDAFSVLLKLIPSGVTLHQQDFIYVNPNESNHEINDSLCVYKNKIHYDQKPVPKSHSNLYFIFKNPHVIRANRDFVFKKPFKNVESFITKISLAIDNIEDYFKGLNDSIITNKLTGEILLSNLNQYLNLQYDGKIAPTGLLNDIQLEENYFKNGSDFVQVISLINEGSGLTDFQRPSIANSEVFGTGVDIDNRVGLKSSFMFPLTIGLPFNHIINTVISVEDEKDIFKELQMRNIQITPIRSAVSLQQQRLIVDYKDHLAEDDVIPVKIGMNVIIHHHELDQVHKRENFVKTALQNMSSAECFTENFNNFQAFLYSCPGNTRNFGHLSISDNLRAPLFLNIEHHLKSDEEGHLYLDRTGAPKLVNLKNEKYINAYHALVFGPTGSGKTLWLHTHIDNSLLNEDIILINTKDDYKKYAELLEEKGYAVRYFDTNDEEIGIDLFFFQVDANGKYLYDDQHILMVKEMLTLMWKNDEEIKEIESTIIVEMVKAFYSHSNAQNARPTFEGFLIFIEIYKEEKSKDESYNDLDGKLFFDFNNFSLIIKNHKNICNESMTIDISKTNFTVFDIGGKLADSKIFKLFLNYTFYVGTRKIAFNQSTGRATKIIIDECVDSMVGRGAEIIGHGFRTYRSKNAAIWLCTQGISYLDSLAVLTKKSIFNNAFTTVLLNHSKAQAEIPFLKENISISDHGVELLNSISTDETLPYREFYLQIGPFQSVYRNQVSPFSLLLFSTTPNVVKKIYEYKKSSGSMENAINNYLLNEN
ncbi:MAG: VirB4 family type IV secretion system protein [Saprospiraceae bacterium]